MKKILFLLLSFFAMIPLIRAQELNAQVSINSNKLQGVSKDVFNTLENSLMQLLNEREWTNTTFSAMEKIECNFVVTLNEMSDGNVYSAELQVTSRRPVFNSAYVTSLFSHRDTDFLFEYTENELLDFNESNISNNLVAVFAFYAYIILGLDFDSFANGGGKPYFDKALQIANAGQTLNTKGWAAFESDRNRYALALALTEEGPGNFHEMWYNYHRLGLDEMASSVTKGRTKIISTVDNLKQIYDARPSSALLLFYGDSKLTELVSIYAQASTEEKNAAYETLRRIFPTKTTQLADLRK